MFSLVSWIILKWIFDFAKSDFRCQVDSEFQEDKKISFERDPQTMIIKNTVDSLFEVLEESGQNVTYRRILRDYIEYIKIHLRKAASNDGNRR